MTEGTHTAASPARIGVGGPVGSGKTALIERLIPVFDKRNLEVAIVTNDLVTKEDAERLQRSGLIDPARVTAVETGACPHTAIREDPTLNIQSADELVQSFPELTAVIIESGGDNLASTFSLELVETNVFAGWGRRSSPRGSLSSFGSPPFWRNRATSSTVLFAVLEVTFSPLGQFPALSQLLRTPFGARDSLQPFSPLGCLSSVFPIGRIRCCRLWVKISCNSLR